jgi:hypothetical protein
MTKQTVSDKTDITILAQLNSSNQVQLFLLETLTALTSEDKVKDQFSKDSKHSTVSVRCVSTDDTVTVRNVGSGPSWSPGTVTSNGVTLYFSDATFDIPSKGSKATKDSFTIQVGSFLADPTVVISRGGPNSNNVSLGTGGKAEK